MSACSDSDSPTSTGNNGSGNGSDTNSDYLPSFGDAVEYTGKNFYEIPLDVTRNKEITPQEMTYTNEEALSVPDLVSFTDFKIKNNFLINNTPLEINKFYTNENGEVNYYVLTPPVKAYSKVKLEGEFNNNVNFLDMVNLARYSIEFKSDIPPISSKYNIDANTLQRDVFETLVFYFQSWMNRHQSLNDIVAYMNKMCDTEFAKNCQNYPFTSSRYAEDNYFILSASGTEIQYKIDLNVRNRTDQKGVNINKLTRENKPRIAESNFLLEDIITQRNQGKYLSEDLGTVMADLISISGFNYVSGMINFDTTLNIPKDIISSQIIKDNYDENVSKKYQPSNIALTVEEISEQDYIISLFSNVPLTDLTMRVLAFDDVGFRLSQSAENKIRFTINEPLSSDIELSFFSTDSMQMASYILQNKFVYLINTQEALNTINSDLPNILDKNKYVIINTKDWTWRDSFIIPTKAQEGTKIIIESQATSPSKVEVNGEVIQLTQFKKMKLIFKNNFWITEILPIQ